MTGLIHPRAGLASVQNVLVPVPAPAPVLVHAPCPIPPAHDHLARNLSLHPVLTLTATVLSGQVLMRRGVTVTRTGADCPTLMT